MSREDTQFKKGDARAVAAGKKSKRGKSLKVSVIRLLESEYKGRDIIIDADSTGWTRMDYIAYRLVSRAERDNKAISLLIDIAGKEKMLSE